MDQLSEALEMLDVETAPPYRLEVAGDWALSFTELRHIRVGAVLTGTMWLTLDGHLPIRLAAGDCYLLATGRPYTLGSDPHRKPGGCLTLAESARPDTVFTNVAPSGVADATAISGALAFDDTAAALLLDQLPAVAQIRAETDEALALRPVLQLLAGETSLGLLGTGAMRDHLSHILFIQTLRTLLHRPAPDPRGWLTALSDHKLRPAIELIHHRPEKPWTVAELAAATRMSRSAFALRFKTAVGLSPLDYLMRWRVQSAARVLRSSDRTISSVAGQFGFGSESSFIRTFKRVAGSSPSQYRAKIRR